MMGASETSGAEYIVNLTNSYIAVKEFGKPTIAYTYDELTDDAVENLVSMLSPPTEFPEEPGPQFPAGHHPDQTKLTRWLFTESEIIPEYREVIDDEFCEIDLDRYSELLYEAYQTGLSGDHLENVTEYLFSGFRPLQVRNRNLRTRVEEIDIVLEVDSDHQGSYFDHYSRYILVECKNLSTSVSGKEVAHFKEKLRRTGIELGFLISWNGVSGQDSGEYGQNYLDQDTRPMVIVLTSKDLYAILDGKSPYKLIDEKIYSWTFGI